MAAPVLRPIRIEGNLAYVPLTQGMQAVIDAADVPLVDGHNWCAMRAREKFYAGTRVVRADGRQTTLLMHKALTGFDLTDHRDGDGLNNRRKNLREATHSQNIQNQGRSRRNTTGFKGVSLCKGRFKATIGFEGKAHYLGNFGTPEAAHAAYCAASLKLHGEFGRTS